MDLKILLLIVMMNHISSSSSELLRAPQQPHNDYAFTKFRPPPPPIREPTFIQRITSWFFPWGYGTTEEEEYSMPASSKIDHLAPPVLPPPTIPAQSILPRFNPVQIRDTEPTTARTTRATNTKCSPCNKVPWIPMVPTYQLPVVKGNQQQQQQQQSQQQQVYFKHYFGNEKQYAQVPPIKNNGYNYNPPSVPTLSPTYGTPPKATESPSTTPFKLQENFGYNQGHHIYGIPLTSQKPIKIIQTTGYHYTTPSTNYQGGYQYTIPSTTFSPFTTLRPNLNTIDTSVITFTTNRPQNNRPSRFTSFGSGVTNAEYIPPPNILPLEGENGGFVPIPIPNLSPTPIPPLFDAKDFHENTYTKQQTGFIKLVPLEPVAQLSNNVNVQAKVEPEQNRNKNSNGVEVVSSNLVAEFTIPPETARDDKIYINQNHRHQNVNTLNQQDVLRQHVVNHNPSVINIDIRNNIDNLNITLSAPIVVESLESNAADNALAESENNYQQNVNQDIDVISLDQLNGDNDEGIVIDHTNRVPLLQDNILDKASEEEEEQQAIEEESTTTEGNYFVKFEPSIQTAADLEDEARKKNQTNNNNKNKHKDRETPLELLDSPIFHITPIARTTLKTTKVPSSNTPPPFKPIEDYTKTLATLWYSATSSLPITSTTEAITSTEVPITTTEATTINYISKLSSTFFSGINLPKEPILKSIISSTKKPKQIQIVIPYTSYHKPSPFKPQNEQEIITYKSIRGHYVTHLPRIKETSTEPIKMKESSTYPPVSYEPLFNAHGYHNDQEYHEHVQESKIVESKLEPPKPTRQLTKIVANNIRDLLKKEKTPKPPKIDIIKLQKSIDGWTEQTFKGKVSTIAQTGHTKPIPSSFLTTTSKATTHMKIPTTTLAPKTTFDPDLMEETRKQYDNILYKKEEPFVKRHDRYLDRDNELLLLNNNLTHNLIHPEPVKIYEPKTTLSPRELWKRLHITISPLNNEKIYVVTPQPKKEKQYGHQNSIKTGKKLKQEISRRMDDSMDLIETEETIDGRSKVIKIITPERKEVTNSIDSTTTTTTTEKSSHS
ncbi:unnamed protein product [Chironomus riparius]|uniref:Uncharacterized protein n=1 Tax=Chironomus riparius TaxID=315576 RepID=A0A9N9RS12_9DIPT|nr:unnamed protein product [Chironomus riparius]